MADKKISQLPAATLPLAGTEVLPIVQSGTTDNITVNNLAAGNIKSNATTGVLQVTGPADASTRVMTTPDANFTIARTDTGQTFTGTNIFGAATTTARTVNIGGSFAVERFGATPQIEMLGGTNSTVGYSYRININQSNWTLTNAVIGSGQANIISIDNATKDVAVSAGNLVIGTSGKGANFTANTPASGMTSQLLNWYEEGIYVPTITCTTSGTVTLNNSFSAVTYTRIGRQVTVTGYCYVSSVSSPVGSFTINLPFAVANEAKGVAFYSPAALVVNDSLTNANNFIGRAVQNTSTLKVSLGNATSLQDTSANQLKAATSVNFSCTYFTS